MKTTTSRRWSTPVTGLALLSCAMAAHAGTGARVQLQVWDPTAPDQQQVVAAFDDPNLVSDSLQDAWDRARPKICEQLQAKMGVGGAAHGETLRDITCLLDDRVVLEVVSAGQNRLRASFAVSGYVEATSTTPDVAFGVGLGEYADPRFSIALTAKFDLIMAVQSSRAQTLRVTQALFTLNDATLDSHNFSGDMAKWVVGDLVPFFAGPDYKRMAENAINAVSVDFANDFDAALAPVNERLAGPSEAVRVGVSGSGNYISAAFAPRELAPPTNGSVSGVLRWDPAQFTPRNGCQSFDIRATVQTGPVPMYTANAEAPVRQLGTFQASQVDAGSCAFTLTGIANGWPNVLTARLLGGNNAQSAGSALYRIHYDLFGDGWDGRNVVPSPVASARDYKVSSSIDATATESAGHAALSRSKRTDPRINPADSYSRQANPGRIVVAPVSDRITQTADTVSLNPQPLPPTSAAQNVRKGSTAIRAKSTANAAAAVGASRVATPQP